MGKFKIEFSEKQKIYALNKMTKETPKGWEIIKENCTFKDFQKFVKLQNQ